MTRYMHGVSIGEYPMSRQKNDLKSCASLHRTVHDSTTCYHLPGQWFSGSASAVGLIYLPIFGFVSFALRSISTISFQFFAVFPLGVRVRRPPETTRAKLGTVQWARQ